MKKIASLLLMLILSLSLFGCKEDVEEYTITLELNGGMGSTSIVVNSEDGITAPTATKEGFTLSGWYEDSAFETKYNFDVFPSKDMTLYAKWNTNRYTIAFELNGGTGISSLTDDFGTTIVEPTPTKEGFTFAGWYKEATLSNIYTFNKMPSENITVYAKWDANEYTITFELNGGTGDTTLNADYATKIVEPTPTKDGFDFAGWYKEGSFTTKYVFDIMPSEDITLYAKWLVGATTITLDLNGGVGESSIVEVPGTTITAPTVPTRVGFTFEGWYSNSALTTSYVFDSMPSADTTIYAKWEMIEYTLTLVASITEATPTKVKGDVINDKQTYTVTAPDVAGYDFKQWQVQGNNTALSTQNVYVYSIIADVTLEAVYVVEGTSTEPTLFYNANFDDGDKPSYAAADLTLNGETWTFSDALVGSLATDLKVSGKSVRIRDGFIETKFAVSDLAQVIFHAGTYGNDDDGLVTFQISVDGSTWVTVDSFTSTGTLEEKSYVFDTTMFANLSLDENESYYFKIVSSNSGRTNIDDFNIYTGEGSVTDDTPLYQISFTVDMVYTYFVDDVVDLDECVATHPTTGATTCDITGTVDSSTAGVYDITYSKTDEFGNTATEIVRITVVSTDNADYLTMDLATYYDDAEGLYGNSLMDALHIIINTGFSGVTYGDARYILDDTDEDPNNASKLILVYLGTSVNESWDSGSTWNREHVWPQSLLGEDADNGTINSASDLYNLMPADPGMNSSRGNNPYSEMGLGFEPRDEVKGDVARALFYMMIMYDELDLVNTAPGIHEMGYLDELLAWHFADPVDDFELDRLEVIFGEQNNRNPFVDYPHFVSLIWFYSPTS